MSFVFAAAGTGNASAIRTKARVGHLPKGTDPAPTTGLSAVAMNGAAGNRTFELLNILGFAEAMIFVQFTHTNNGVLTLTCTGSNDGTNTIDFTPTVCNMSGGVCTLQTTAGVYRTNEALTGNTNYSFPIGLGGYRDMQCVLAHGGSPAAGDIVTLTYYLLTDPSPPFPSANTGDNSPLGACVPVSGHATSLADISSSSAAGPLTPNSVWMVFCTGATRVRWEMGDGSGATADANSMLIANNTTWYIGTGNVGTSDYFSAVDSAATAGSCELIRCL
jgi:hypothetical protein